ncbi:MAG: hypothetical protein D6775_01790 [Caldilineae bacterium]|nr:MAG: hypothetical protein D6775_01790 [Caldilineae bacterium]
MEKLDFQSIHIGDILMEEAGDAQRAEAGMTIVAFAFVPLLGGREVVIDSPKQGGSLQSLL